MGQSGAFGAVLRRRGTASVELATALRQELMGWARAEHVSAELVGDIGLAAYEAMANTVLHAYPRGTHGVLELDVSLSGRALTVTVVDHGQWRGTRVVGPGHGLPLIRELPDHTEIWTDEYGTAVSMTWRTITMS